MRSSRCCCWLHRFLRQLPPRRCLLRQLLHAAASPLTAPLPCSLRFQSRGRSCPLQTQNTTDKVSTAWLTVAATGSHEQKGTSTCWVSVITVDTQHTVTLHNGTAVRTLQLCRWPRPLLPLHQGPPHHHPPHRWCCSRPHPWRQAYVALQGFHSPCVRGVS